MSNVGIVIVSHSPLVAEGAADMVRQMVGDEVPLAWCGGNPDGGLGTRSKPSSPPSTAPGRTRASRSSSIWAAPRPIPRWPSKCSMATAPARSWSAMRRSSRARSWPRPKPRAARRSPRSSATAEELSPDDVTRPASAEAQVLITHEVGLHARPSVKLTKLAKGFAARIDLALAEAARGSTPSRSSRSWRPRRPRARRSSSAPRATTPAKPIAALVGLVERDFDEGGRMPSPLRSTGTVASHRLRRGPLFRHRRARRPPMPRAAIPTPRPSGCARRSPTAATEVAGLMARSRRRGRRDPRIPARDAGGRQPQPNRRSPRSPRAPTPPTAWTAALDAQIAEYAAPTTNISAPAAPTSRHPRPRARAS